VKSLVVASGKGGVGKTVIAASLSLIFHRRGLRPVVAEGDVDTPNLHLLLGFNHSSRPAEVVRASRKAYIVADKCTGCGLCLRTCQFSAIERRGGRYYVDRYLCEGCGACRLVCPAEAINLREEITGEIYVGITRYGFPMVTAKLRVGEKNSGLLVTKVKERALLLEGDVAVIDGAPGIGCEVIAALSGSNCLVAVTEPTPASFNGFKRLLELASCFRLPVGLIINKYNISWRYASFLESYAEGKGVKILAKLPLDFKVVESVAASRPIVDYEPSSAVSKGLEEAAGLILDSLLK